MLYIVSKGNYVSGGPETLHQAANLFIAMGQRVGMYYVQPHTMKIPKRFQEYNIEVVDKIVIILKIMENSIMLIIVSMLTDTL